MASRYVYKTHRTSPQTAHRTLCGLFLGGSNRAHTTVSEDVTCGQCIALQEKDKK